MLANVHQQVVDQTSDKMTWRVNASNKLGDHLEKKGAKEAEEETLTLRKLMRIFLNVTSWVSHFLDCVNSNPGQGIFPNHREDSSSHPLPS